MPSLIICDKFGKIIETHHFDGSLVDWLKTNVETYTETTRPPYSATLNGNPWAYINHNDLLIENDEVVITIEPQNPAVVMVVIALISAAYSYYISQNIDTGYQGSDTRKGSNIYNPNARANAVKPSGIVRACAGSYSIFPDYICPIRRKFIDHEEYLYVMMAVTDGHMFIRDKNIYIAETPIINYSGDYNMSIFDPGDDVSGHEAHENWYTSREISGLELVTSTSELAGNWSASYSADTMTVFLDGSLETFPFSVDTTIQITSGSNQGFYRVFSIGSPDHTATLIKQQKEENSNITANGVARIAARAAARAASPSRTFNMATRYVSRNMLIDSTTSPQTSLTAVSPAETITWRAENGAINWEGPFELIPVNETCRYLEVDINFPAGLVELDDNGDELDNTVEIAIEYREVGTNTWTRAVDTSRSPNTTIYTAATLDERGYTVEIDMGSAIRPELRIRRITRDADSTKIRNTSYIRRVKAKLETATSYSKVSTIALSLRGTNALASTAENKINIKGATRKLPTLQEIQDAADGTPFDLSSSATQTVSDYLVSNDASYISATDLNLDDYYPTTSGTANSVHFSPDGLRLLTYENGVLRSFTLTVAFDASQGLTYNTYSTASPSVFGKNALWADSGLKIITLRKASDPSPHYDLTQYDLSVAYDLSTISVAISQYATSGEVGVAEQFCVSNDGTAIWIASRNGDVVQYTMSTPWDLSTLTQDQIGSPLSPVHFDTSTELNIQSPNTNLVGFWLDDYSVSDPSKMWMIDGTGRVYIYTMSTPGDISTCVFDSFVTIAENRSLSIETIQVTANHFHICTFSGDSFITTWLLDDTTDSRASKSLIRFAALELYNALGSDVGDAVDWDNFASIDSTLESRSDFFNGEFVDETTLWEALRLLLAPGYCEPAMKEGKLNAIRTVAGSDYNHLYTPDFMLGDGLTITEDHYDGQEPDGIDVEYLDEDSGESEIIECRLSGDAGLRPKRIQAIGITNATRAWRFGMRQRREIFYKPSNFIFNTEMDGLNSEYGDPIAIASDIFGSQSGTVTAASGSNITLDFSPTYDTSASPMDAYFAAFKKPNGEFSGLYTITMGSPNNVIVITDSPGLDFTPVTNASPESDGENTLVVIGKSSEWGVRAIVRSVEPQGDSTAQVIAQEYVAAIFDDDNNSPP